LFDEFEVGVIYTSTDNSAQNWKVTWQASNKPPGDPISTVAFGNGLFVTADKDYFWTSSDGVTWNSGSTSIISGCPITFIQNNDGTKGIFYMMCDDLIGIVVSVNGSYWQGANIPIDSIGGISIAYIDGMEYYIITGGDGEYYTSTDGLNYNLGGTIDEYDYFSWIASKDQSTPLVAASYSGNYIFVGN